MSTSLPVGAPGGTAPVPDGETLELRFAVGSPRMEAHAAVPTLRFDLRVDASGAVIRSVSLNAQVRIVAPSRRYDDATKAWHVLRELIERSA